MSELPETWSNRELPILRRILERFDSGDVMVDVAAIRSELPNIPPQQFRVALRALADAGYIDYYPTMGGPNRVTGHVNNVHERTRRELGTWPTADQLVGEIAIAFHVAAEQAIEPEEKNRLQAVADAIGGFARDVAVGVVSKHVGG